ncbi:hypothetical protein ILP92_07745 [Maribius pontilimi]|uniref:DUF4157 domain-containing protein n=1 Tax=Palleronia pontilimi TaxID=1964209 RepID=A0A934IHE6_9RHOB|nr:hypothetical protein [Palleronia pontilimi]MBJ3762635.1 hypothetical protein [Palleronia pontilimi]
MLRLALLILLLSACARPLTPGERNFVASVHGPALDTSRVRVHRGALIGNLTHERPARPAKACRERIRPEETGTVKGSIAALVVFNRIFYAKRYFLSDFLADYPEAMQLEDAMLLAHELTHVWQWQQRETTGYHPFLAASEHRPGGDPYLFELDADLTFDDFGYEQQGSLVEEFVCCRALDPDGDRTRRLYDILKPVFPALSPRSPVPQDGIALFWSQAPRKGICS